MQNFNIKEKLQHSRMTIFFLIVFETLDNFFSTCLTSDFKSVLRKHLVNHYEIKKRNIVQRPTAGTIT